jgi:3-isopropylmalate/(R)-2-methylmalate dehydratase small subunit
MTNAGAGRRQLAPWTNAEAFVIGKYDLGKLGWSYEDGMADGSRQSGRLIAGRAVLLGDAISTDAIIAGKYCKMAEGPQLAAHIFEATGYQKKGGKGEKGRKGGGSWKGTIIIAGRNFGCGSSREQAPLALKAAGVRAVAARSFGRIFFRNAVNIGLPVMNIDRHTDHVRDGDEVWMDLSRGSIRNRTMDVIKGRPLPDILMRILDAGGLVPLMRTELARNAAVARSAREVGAKDRALETGGE